MTKEEIYQRIEEILIEEKGEDLLIRPDLIVQKELAEDSVEIMELVLLLEDEFHITISDEAIEKFETLADIVDYIEQKRA
ncbi:MULTISPECIES: phosphopantetheine-binding protein [unclassified Streptococcus]|uniref:phosphopantetheine-binding protein n=1 Tax=unclassified Streptococcus TaxID=2608887 RepID=UPI0010724A12|nr:MULTISPECIES: phosphopantetheine-binding protein [unclassified Streptococcus]MBF0787733.1 acyl carrier protein [Streptococcus sp. 19428wC2_LYSM12]MCQ9211545.1 phosphopantetheine-binding protein [Streptococcus sp. B01]MCQ9214861.1 phosphopantetheine-binding protein [Streptococcus sp. O1]TFV05232.1 acyl carrier protein [Streptococcus sp. LYSM12]